MNLSERLTDAEERIRDNAVKPLLALLPTWVRPNHITGTRLILVSSAFILYLFNKSLAPQIWILTAAILTDFIDGPLARLRSQCSRKGAYLDQIADWCLGIWTGVLALLTGLLPAIVIVLMVTPQIGVLVTDRIRVARLSTDDGRERALAIAMGAANFRSTTIERLQFVTVLLGFMLIVLSKMTDRAIWHRIGLGSLYIEIVLVWLFLFQGIANVIAKR